MYVEASWPRTEGDVAELQSEWLSTTKVQHAAPPPQIIDIAQDQNQTSDTKFAVQQI